MNLGNTDIAAIRDQLLSMRRALEAGVISRRDAVARTGHIERGGVDRGDESSQAVESGLGITQADRAVYELSLVKGALARLEKGEFGICLDCGETIGSARLLANPIAKRCLACQVRREEG